MGRSDYYSRGSWNRICDDCGAKRKAEDTVRKWNGMIVCRDTCFESRNPQDFVRGVHDRQRVPDPRPEYVGSELSIDIDNVRIDDEFVTIDQQGDRFLDTNEVTVEDL